MKELAKKLIDKAMDKYRQNYSTQHALIRLLEEWREGLDNKFVVRFAFMDLSKAFDCIPHDLLIVKLKAYGFDDYLVYYLYSYVDNRKQCVCVYITKNLTYKI